MARNEFTKATKRAALKRSGLLCEAVGSWYGLDDGQRCNAPLSAGVQYDHVILDANSKDNSLENCAAVCIKCHKFKTAKHDTPLAARTLRQQDKARGIRTAPAKPIRGPGFSKTEKAAKRQPKANLPYRQLYRPNDPQDLDRQEMSVAMRGSK